MLQLLTFLVKRVSLLLRLHPSQTSWLQLTEEPRAPPPPLQRGDLLEVPRTLFTHFGIYLGDNRVAHLIPDILLAFTSDSKLIHTVITNDRLILGCICRSATVRVDSLDDFAYGSDVLVNQLDRATQLKPLATDCVAQRAEKLVGRVAYSLLWNNCEHFVTHCRYGCAISQQTEQFFGSLKSIIRDQRSVILTGLLGLICMAYFGTALSTALPTLLIPFTLWMAG